MLFTKLLLDSPTYISYAAGDVVVTLDGRSYYSSLMFFFSLFSRSFLGGNLQYTLLVFPTLNQPHYNYYRLFQPCNCVCTRVFVHVCAFQYHDLAPPDTMSYPLCFQP